MVFWAPKVKELHAFGAADLGNQLGYGLEKVGDETVVGDLEDGGFGVLVDGDDDLGAFHAGQVLDGSRDADRKIELGRDDLARLADLEIAGSVAGVAGGAAGAHR